MTRTKQETSTAPSKADRAELLDVQTVAQTLDCSARHIYRLADSRQMPAPVRLGALVRWRRTEIERWLEDGCPTCRKAVRR